MIPILVSVNLEDKDVFIDGALRAVYGVVALHTNPKRIGVGTAIVRCIEQIAKRDNKYCLVGFCRPNNWGFWNKCKWFAVGVYENRMIITSEWVENIIVTEHW